MGRNKKLKYACVHLFIKYYDIIILKKNKKQLHFINKKICTWFVPKISKLDARKKWIASTLQIKGCLKIDEGAQKALQKGKSKFKTLRDKFLKKLDNKDAAAIDGLIAGVEGIEKVGKKAGKLTGKAGSGLLKGAKGAGRIAGKVGGKLGFLGKGLGFSSFFFFSFFFSLPTVGTSGNLLLRNDVDMLAKSVNPEGIRSLESSKIFSSFLK